MTRPLAKLPAPISMHWRDARASLFEAESEALEALLAELENVAAALEEDERLMRELRSFAALVRDRRNERNSLARALRAQDVEP